MVCLKYLYILLYVLLCKKFNSNSIRQNIKMNRLVRQEDISKSTDAEPEPDLISCINSSRNWQISGTLWFSGPLATQLSSWITVGVDSCSELGRLSCLSGTDRLRVADCRRKLLRCSFPLARSPRLSLANMRLRDSAMLLSVLSMCVICGETSVWP